MGASRCDHYFHEACIDKWFTSRAYQQRTCPLCKRDPLAGRAPPALSPRVPGGLDPDGADSAGVEMAGVAIGRGASGGAGAAGAEGASVPAAEEEAAAAAEDDAAVERTDVEVVSIESSPDERVGRRRAPEEDAEA